MQIKSGRKSVLIITCELNYFSLKIIQVVMEALAKEYDAEYHELDDRDIKMSPLIKKVDAATYTSAQPYILID